ncbi:MAG: hypothetical protein AAGG56_06985 [Pseudomonadota bacterium]
MLDLADVINRSLDDPETGWNMGSFGAIAEFHHVYGDPAATRLDERTRVTARGGIKLANLQTANPIAYETLSPKPHRWAHAVALCLPSDEAAMARRDCLTELGADTDALRTEDRSAILFDMGLGQHQVDFCIRTEDPELLDALRAAEGRSLFEPGNTAITAILAAHPHRVALTRFGRVEVYQKIGGPDTGGKSPEGPHTHVLPKLLRAARTHSANAPIPEGWVPCGSFHPSNPVFGRLGEDREFDLAAFDAFQDLLKAWGVSDYTVAKKAAWDALSRGVQPERYVEPENRIARSGLRNAIRQWRRLHGESPAVRAWASRFDRDPALTEDEAPGH